MGQRFFEVLALHEALRLGDLDAAPEVVSRAGLVEGELVRAFGIHAAALAATDPVALEASSQAFEAIDAPLLAAEASAEAAGAYDDQGRQASSRASTARAVALAARCEGSKTPALARLDIRPLTKREREIALLAARGLSSREIAERLTVSVRTVENHLHKVYGKLGVEGREGLEPLLQRGLAGDQP
jgi:DNA-binding CsgD family transcriptional regulator